MQMYSMHKLLLILIFALLWHYRLYTLSSIRYVIWKVQDLGDIKIDYTVSERRFYNIAIVFKLRICLEYVQLWPVNFFIPKAHKRVQSAQKGCVCVASHRSDL